jgi:DNA-binding LytR/AlgR family response regulator
MKCVLLDDELPGLTYLKMLCQQIAEIEIVKAYNDPEKFVNDIDKLDFELCILDIEMPKINGVQVAGLLKDKLVIFTTAYRDYAADAFDLNAVDYVQKPVQKDRLELAVRKAIERRPVKEKIGAAIQLNTDRGKALIDADKLAFVTTSDVDSRDKVAFMLDNTSFVLKNISFEGLLKILPEGDFCRVNKKQLIAIKIISSFTFEEVISTMQEQGNPIRFSLSEVYRQHFQKLIRIS